VEGEADGRAWVVSDRKSGGEGKEIGRRVNWAGREGGPAEAMGRRGKRKRKRKAGWQEKEREKWGGPAEVNRP
jgi:hypothetical protein